MRLHGVLADTSFQPPNRTVDCTAPYGAAVLRLIPTSLRLDAKTAIESTRYGRVVVQKLRASCLPFLVRKPLASFVVQPAASRVLFAFATSNVLVSGTSAWNQNSGEIGFEIAETVPPRTRVTMSCLLIARAIACLIGSTSEAP